MDPEGSARFQINERGFQRWHQLEDMLEPLAARFEDQDRNVVGGREEAVLLDAWRARQALDDLAAFRIERYPHDLFLPRVWSLRANATAYDACYLALAEALEAPLLTSDRRLAGIPGHRAAVEVIG